MSTTTLRPFAVRIVDAVRGAVRRLGRTERLGDLDDRTLADIGVSRSEIASIEAESRGWSSPSRRRIVTEPSHA